MAAMMPAMPKRADQGKTAIPRADSMNPPTMIGRRPRPAALMRSDAAPLHGTRRSISTLSIAITMPIAVRCSPRASRTIGGMNVLSSGPVTPAKSPPSPMRRQVPYGTRSADAVGAGVAAVTVLSISTQQYCRGRIVRVTSPRITMKPMFLSDVEGSPSPESPYTPLIEAAQASGREYPKIWHLFAFKPHATAHLARFTQEILREEAPLSPGFRELIAARTSGRNDCPF